MRLDKPDDEIGGWLFLSLPSVVVHRVDAWSPLYPPPAWLAARGKATQSDAGPEAAYRFPAPLQRESDAAAGGRTAFRCKLCGEGYETREALLLHHADAHAGEPPPVPPPVVDAATVREYVDPRGTRRDRVDAVDRLDWEDSPAAGPLPAPTDDPRGTRGGAATRPHGRSTAPAAGP